MPRTRKQEAERPVKKAAKQLPKVEPRKRPQQARVYPQRADGKAVVKAQIRNQAHIAAMIDPSTLNDWDEEELARGYRRDKNGNFTGRPPKYVPMIVAEEMIRRGKIDTLIKLSKLGSKAIKALERIIDNEMSDEKAQVAAAKLILDRMAPAAVTGAVEHLHKAEPKFLKALESGIVSTDDSDDDIIDAEIIEDTG